MNTHMRAGALLLMLFIGSITRCLAQGLSPEELTEAAKLGAAAVKHPVEKMRIIYDEENRQWEAFIKSLAEMYSKNSIPAPSIIGDLKGKQYQAVCFVPLEGQEEYGSLWIFVDMATGEVLGNWYYG